MIDMLKEDGNFGAANQNACMTMIGNAENGANESDETICSCTDNLEVHTLHHLSCFHPMSWKYNLFEAAVRCSNPEFPRDPQTSMFRRYVYDTMDDCGNHEYMDEEDLSASMRSSFLEEGGLAMGSCRNEFHDIYESDSEIMGSSMKASCDSPGVVKMNFYNGFNCKRNDMESEDNMYRIGECLAEDDGYWFIELFGECQPCCKANTIECKACAAGVKEKKYCKKNKDDPLCMTEANCGKQKKPTKCRKASTEDSPCYWAPKKHSKPNGKGKCEEGVAPPVPVCADFEEKKACKKAKKQGVMCKWNKRAIPPTCEDK